MLFLLHQTPKMLQQYFEVQLTKQGPGVVKLKSSSFIKLEGVLKSCFMKVGVVCLWVEFQHGLGT